MLVHPWDASASAEEWRAFLRCQRFGQLIAAGRDRQVPVVVPTQFLLVDGREILLHLARPNPVWAAIAENFVVLLSVAGDWAYIPSAWKAIDGEDAALGIPTTYYAAVQVTCDATVVDDEAGKLEILRQQMASEQPDVAVADPAAHQRKLAGIRGLRLSIREVTAKFKYGGNVDAAHRKAVAGRLADRDGPGDRSVREHVLRRLDEERG